MMETLQTNYYDQTHGQRGSGCLLNSGLIRAKTTTTESLKYDVRLAYLVPMPSFLCDWTTCASIEVVV